MICKACRGSRILTSYSQTCSWLLHLLDMRNFSFCLTYTAGEFLFHIQKLQKQFYHKLCQQDLLANQLMDESSFFSPLCSWASNNPFLNYPLAGNIDIADIFTVSILVHENSSMIDPIVVATSRELDRKLSIFMFYLETGKDVTE